MVLLTADILLIAVAAATPAGAVLGAAYYAGRKVGEICARLEVLLNRLDRHEIKMTDMQKRIRLIERKTTGGNQPDRSRQPAHAPTTEDVHYGG
jgi:hypothetical protein